MVRKYLKLQLVVVSLMVAVTQIALAGDSRGGGDWFVKPLPLLKIQFPETTGFVEGIEYKKMILPRCDEINYQIKYPDYQLVAYFPGENFEAIKVQTSFSNIVCSYGVVERDSDKALQILVNNEETNRTHSINGTVLYSKSFGGPTLVGNFIAIIKPNGKLALFGNNQSLNFETEPHFWNGPLNQPMKNTDTIVIPSGIQVSSRVYFGHNELGMWRILLPVAYDESALKFQKLSTELDEVSQANDPRLLDLLNIVAMPKGFPGGYADSWAVVAQIWHTLEYSSRNWKLRNDLFERYGIPLDGRKEHSYEQLQKLSDTFRFTFSPTIGMDKINHASFFGNENRVEFTLPLLNPTWREVADMIHEMTHALQKQTDPPSDDEIFQNEMKAHLNEREYLQEIGDKYPVLKTLIPIHRYIVAAGVPKIVFVKSKVLPEQTTLCAEVINAYGLDSLKISESSKARFNCDYHSH